MFSQPVGCRIGLFLGTLVRIRQIYCNGPILKAVQDASLFPDSKYFVDMPLKYDPVTTLKDFNELGERAKDREVLQQFVDEHFDPPGFELIECYPVDWVAFPSSFLKIEDYHLRRWALHLHRIWRDLCRRVKDDVRQHQELYSLLYVPHPFIIPGGRFREFYYWDSFWILKGLLFSEMYETAKGVIRNLAYMVENHGFVPNGGRVYYLIRSQPPLLSPMLYEYYLATGDLEAVNEILPMLEKEYNFWLMQRARPFYDESENEKFQFFQYRAHMKTPRPESYREDMDLVRNITSDAEKELLWSNVASAAETGWDFSTRWFAQSGPAMHHMRSIRTWSIVPVDLNAFMCMNARILASLFEITGNFSKVFLYQARYEQAKMAMKQIHWNETDGIWYDYDLDRKVHSNTYYVSNALPLYAKCYDDEDDVTPHRVYEYLKREGVLNFTKGLPTSLAMGSEQQWDKENAWPPMVHMVIEGFRTTGDPQLMKAAETMATQWLGVTYKSFIRTHSMFEKYNVSAMTEECSAGSGGEYEVQTGFGWTNGVILDLLDKYGDKMATAGGSPISLSIFLSLLNFLLFFHRFLFAAY
uniref:Trehalase n=1 Tax=Ascaris lumbricoides TaxID=6252 RepID=A0A0M3I3U5_ASCLU